MNDLVTATWYSVIISAILVIVTAIFYIIMAFQNRKTVKLGMSQIQVMSEQLKANIEQTSVMRQQLEMIIKERERPRIIELIQHVLSPLVHSLLIAIERHESGEIDYCEELMVTSLDEEYFRDFIRKFPQFGEKIKKFNEITKVVNAKIDDLIQEINTSEFREKCHELIVAYNQASPEKRLLEDYTSINKEYSKRFALHIIQNKRGDLGGAYIYNKFWQLYGDELLKVRLQESISDKLTEFEHLWKEYGDKAQELKEALEKQREIYGEEYKITRKEFWAQQVRLF